MALYISEIKITNVRCFDSKGIKIRFRQKGERTGWTTLLGDNATGKTTLLKCIALGLCDESSAAGLIRESEEGYIRRGKKIATILIKFYDSRNRKREIRTEIRKIILSDGRSFEKLHQETFPKKFPWDEVFVCAYGVGRGISGTGDISGYNTINAVYNLFNYSEGLQNPELILYRLRATESFTSERVLETICSFAMRSANVEKVKFDEEGLKIKGRWGEDFPLRDVADGIKSMFQWIMDFIGWAISFSPKLKDIKKISGIVIIDALEEHLHPKWQRHVVGDLCDAFPNVQFVVSAHSPLIASGTADISNAQLVALKLEEHNIVKSKCIPLSQLGGLRADQVLRSDAFDLVATASPDSISDVTKYYELKLREQKNELTLDDKRLLNFLKKKLQNLSEAGDTKIEQDVKRELYKALNKVIKRNLREIYKYEIDRQLNTLILRTRKDA